MKLCMFRSTDSQEASGFSEFLAVAVGEEGGLTHIHEKFLRPGIRTMVESLNNEALTACK